MPYSITDLPAHPHMKLTREEFPRALATRMLADDGDEYFGAFLNRTSVRILIDFLNRTFRLRTCTIEIDGSFPVPCTQYYAKRCVAPCVADLCSRDQYLEIVDLVRLFLRNDRELFLASISRKIELASTELDFETAASFRDVLQAVEKYWSNERYKIWLDDTVDTFELEADNDAVSVIIISQRRRRPLGELVYQFPLAIEAERALPAIIDQYYRFHLPREIRVSHDFKGRTKLAGELGKRFGRKINIVVAAGDARRVTTGRVLHRTRERLALDAIIKKPDTRKVKADLASRFRLRNPPSRIEAFDAAHISATGFAAGVSVWQDGKDLPDEYEHWQSDRESEIDTLRAFVAARTVRTSPDLILIDGGRSHLNAAIQALEVLPGRPSVISAVKPKGKHASISHFLMEDGSRIEFNIDTPACRLLQRLRDAAHDLANSTHRLGRDMLHFYELAAMIPSLAERERHELLREFGSIKAIAGLDPALFVSRFGGERGTGVIDDIKAFRDGEVSPQPLIVPISYVDPEGAAADLIPIATR